MAEEKKPTLDELMMRLEKIDGKLEVVDRFRETTDERTSRLSEQIGELRSMMMERERSSRNMEADFEKIKILVKEIDPMSLVKESEKKEKKIVENRVKIEKLENRANKLVEEVAGFRRVMDKIKSFENLVKLSKEVKEKISNIEDSKKYTDRMAAKVESIFSELNKKLLEIEEYKGKIENTDELTRDLVKSLDEAKLKITDLVERIGKLPTSKEFEDKQFKLASIVDALEKKVRLLELERISDDLGRRMKEQGPGIDELRRVDELSRERGRIVELMMSVEEDFKQGMISKESYDEVKKRNQEMLDDIKAVMRDDLLRLEQSLGLELGKITAPPELEVKPEMKVETSMPVEASIPAGVPLESMDIEAPEAPPIPKVKEAAAETEAIPKAPAMDASSLEKKVKLMETEKGVIEGLLGQLSTETSDKKRGVMEKKYRERLEKISKELSGLKQKINMA